MGNSEMPNFPKLIHVDPGAPPLKLDVDGIMARLDAMPPDQRREAAKLLLSLEPVIDTGILNEPNTEH